jgi:DNA replication and repair protein RecF
MPITRIEIHGVRNITKIKLNPNPSFNIIHGLNGSGKTSFLEAIYLLGTGKSFKSHENKRIIQHGLDELHIYAEYSVDNLVEKLGLEKKSDGSKRIHINNSKKSSLTELAEKLPLHIIPTTSHRLFLDGPKTRRQFIDQGLFHVNHDFMGHWKKYESALKQRNAGLKMRINNSELMAWNKQMAESGEAIALMRHDYIHELTPIINKLYTAFLTGHQMIQLQIKQGWEKGRTLSEELHQNHFIDQKCGFTTKGPHRADISITIDDTTPIKDHLSQGQLKLASYAMNIAKCILLQQKKSKQSIILIDDLPSELDKHSVKKICGILQSLDCQCFITAIDENNITSPLDKSEKEVFHMKHGECLPSIITKDTASC